MALANMERFLRLTVPLLFFALLAENREILKLMVSLFGMSEFLSKILVATRNYLDTAGFPDSASSIKERGRNGR